MTGQNLQKSAEKNSATPKEVLNAEETAAQYKFRIYQASGSLTSFVDYYWTMRWNLANKPPFKAEVIPSPYTNLTFMPEGARITGVTTGKYDYLLKDRGVIIGVKFKPGALRTFYGKSLSTITDVHIPAQTVFSEIDKDFNLRIINTNDNKAVEIIEKLLISYKPVVDKQLQIVSSAINYIESNDSQSVESLGSRFNLSERRLQEIFREYVGVGIKWIILRMRLIRAVELAANIGTSNWTNIAQQLGYADQSHFTNDFKRTIGQTPSQYAATIQKNK